jgi:hypothetical protein
MTDETKKETKRLLKPKKLEIPWKEITIFVTGVLIGVLI